MIEQLEPAHPISKYLTPDWELSTKHGLATKIGLANDQQLEYCHCCFHHVHKDPISLCGDTKQLEFLGFGVPLYFALVRNCIFVLLVMIFSYNLPSLYYALSQNQLFCQSNLNKQTNSTLETLHSIQPDKNAQTLRQFYSLTEEIQETQIQHKIQCTGWMIHMSRIRNTVEVEEQILRFGSLMIHLILLIYIRDKLTKMKYYFDQRSTTPSDFSVFIKNMPAQKGQKQALKQILKTNYNVNNLHDIILIPDMSSFYQLQYKQQIVIKDLQKKTEKQQNADQEIRLILEFQNQMDTMIRTKKLSYSQDQLEAEKALVLFNTQDQKWDLINGFVAKKPVQKDWMNVHMSEASEPNQILWQNSCLKGSHKKMFKFLGWFFSILTLLLATAIFALLSQIKSHLVEQKIQQYRKSQQHGNESNLLNEAFGLVMGMIFLVVLFNKFILSHLFHKFTEIERHSNTYKFQFYYCLKYCLGLFFTTALMTIIIEDLLFDNYFKHSYGVVQEETIMFIFNSSFVPLFWLINPVYLSRKIKRKLKFGSQFLTQHEANHMMENPVYDVGKRYGEVMEIMWFTFLYMTIIPIGAMISCVGLIAYYWVDKFNLQRRSVVHNFVSGDLINLTLNMLEFTILLRVLGQMQFDYQLRGTVYPVTWASLAIAIGYFFLPSQYLVNLFNFELFNNQRLSYSEAQQFFKNTYYNVHILFNYLQQDRKKILEEKAEKRREKNNVIQIARNRDIYIPVKDQTMKKMYH